MKHLKNIKPLIFIGVSCLAILSAAAVHAEEAKITFKDSNVYHVHTPGEPFSISLTPTYKGEGVISYHWVDYKGSALTASVPLQANKENAIKSPTGDAGYYGLVLESSSKSLTLPNRKADETREWGFAALDKLRKDLNPDNKFGIVHADYKDPYIGTLIKALYWLQTGADWMDWEVKQRLDNGKIDLPIIAGGVWDTDDKVPVTQAQLDELRERALDWFDSRNLSGGVSPQPQYYWELGIEENLQGDYGSKYYWPNLVAKAKAVREAAIAAGKPDIKFVYQIAGTGISDIRRFMKSEAAACFDIMSIHPYAWAPYNFAAPDTWFDKWWSSIQSAIKQTNWTKPIWFTEVGAPINENTPGAFYGYTEHNPPTKVVGLTRASQAEYMVKLVTMSLQKGVDKIYWYNYQDGGPRREHPEDNFGMKDYNGFLKPGYTSWYVLTSNLEGKTAAGAAVTADNVKIFRFDGTGEDTYVMWSYPAAQVSVSLNDIRNGLNVSDILRVNRIDAGKGNMPSGDRITVDGSPIFVTVKD